MCKGFHVVAIHACSKKLEQLLEVLKRHSYQSTQYSVATTVTKSFRFSQRCCNTVILREPNLPAFIKSSIGSLEPFLFRSPIFSALYKRHNSSILAVLQKDAIINSFLRRRIRVFFVKLTSWIWFSINDTASLIAETETSAFELSRLCIGVVNGKCFGVWRITAVNDLCAR